MTHDLSVLQQVDRVGCVTGLNPGTVFQSTNLASGTPSAVIHSTVAIGSILSAMTDTYAVKNKSPLDPSLHPWVPRVRLSGHPTQASTTHLGTWYTRHHAMCLAGAGLPECFEVSIQVGLDDFDDLQPLSFLPRDFPAKTRSKRLP